jgi:glycosyltransferase involved in cell wall biosynthesis
MAQPLRIFHINMHRQWGGQPNRVLMTAEGLRSLGHDVVVSGPRGCMLVERARARGFEVFDDLELARGFRPLSMRRDVTALRAHFGARRYDVIDTHGSQDTWAARLAARGLEPRPAFVRTRHNIFPVSGNFMNRWLYRGIDHVVTVSPQVIPLLGNVIAAEHCTAIYSAPDPERFRVGPARDEARAELGIAAQEQVVGVVARLAPEKGHRVLIDAAPEILRALPRTRFVFVGRGRSRPDIEAQIAALGLRDRFILTGFREDVPRLLQAFDLFVLCPTDGESLGTSILEAFTMGLPVVATDVGGVSESVIAGRTGWLVPPGQPGPLAAAVVEALTHREEAARRAAQGRARVAEIFTPEAIARQTEAVYLKVLDRIRAGTP